jgi:hypothetical protein
MSTAHEIELKRRDYEARTALPLLMLNRQMGKLTERVCFKIYDDTLPEYEASVAVLRSVSPQHKRRMTQRIRWGRWTALEVSFETPN